jgi:hypothetical protein
MELLRPGLWTWTGRHPAWTDSDEWDPDVRSYAVDLEGGLVLIDPVTPPAELLRRDPAIVLTAPWHRRSSEDIGEPLAEPPRGIEARPAYFPEDRMLWIARHNALVLGDSLMNAEPIPDEWLDGASREDYNAALRPLLDLPIELLLPTHGAPIVHGAHEHLARALGAR